MEFFNSTKRADFVDQMVVVFLTSIDGKTTDSVEPCFMFEHDGSLCLDLIPPLNRKYVVQVPDKSSFSESQGNGALAVFINSLSDVGLVIRSLINQKESNQA